MRTEAELEEVRIPIWVSRLSSMGLPDLRYADVRDPFDVTLGDLTADDWSACQRAGVAMRAEGVRGVLSPSAALADSTNNAVVPA
jgi:autotransporter translocation and assembly factor TamB